MIKCIKSLLCCSRLTCKNINFTLTNQTLDKDLSSSSLRFSLSKNFLSTFLCRSLCLASWWCSNSWPAFFFYRFDFLTKLVLLIPRCEATCSHGWGSWNLQEDLGFDWYCFSFSWKRSSDHSSLHSLFSLLNLKSCQSSSFSLRLRVSSCEGLEFCRKTGFWIFFWLIWGWLLLTGRDKYCE